ncbi:GNAT family N-acetyltransferase [Actinoplanes subglobosus]|uniref:GNAT family N-acetyltransferase n=1 Tax=Actinoplanes subglobosus TaxID=1547892 RepID=A0ABV8J1I0_9ACTN
MTGPPVVRAATAADTAGILALAAEVEPWFGPMLSDPDFHAHLHRNIDRGTAHVTGDLSGAILTGGRVPAYRIGWLVVAGPARGRGIGRALLSHVLAGFVRPCRVDVVTFGADHPGAGSRDFYRRLGFTDGDPEPDGPDGGSRQRFTRYLQRCTTG